MKKVIIGCLLLSSCSKPDTCYVCATSKTTVDSTGNSLSLQQTLSEFCGSEDEMLMYQKDNSGNTWTPINSIWETECK